MNLRFILHAFMAIIHLIIRCFLLSLEELRQAFPFQFKLVLNQISLPIKHILNFHYCYLLRSLVSYHLFKNLDHL